MGAGARNNSVIPEPERVEMVRGRVISSAGLELRKDPCLGAFTAKAGFESALSLG